MLVVLDHRALEPPLPDVAPAVMQLVITLRMGDQEALHQPTHRTRDRTQQQMLIPHQAVTIQLGTASALSNRPVPPGRRARNGTGLIIPAQ